MFSVKAATPWTSTGAPSRATARRTASTIAAPDMSYFMPIMPSAVLSDRPPESKVMPLPTRATVPVTLPLGV
ncbi:hypothetical protein D3C83_165220 [compost metagenome]